jgi:tetratricopeptide (TPR) repeat protein
MHLLGVVHMQQGQYEEAKRLISKAVRIKTDYAPAFSNLGLVLRHLGGRNEALRNFDRAIALQPGLAENHYNRGLSLMDLGRAADALAAFERAIALVPTYVDAVVGRGNALRRLDRGADALAAFEQAVALQPNHLEALHNRAAALQDLGQADGALRHLDQALALFPDAADLYVARGIALFDLGRFEDSLAAFDRATALNPRHVAAHLGRGNTLVRLGRGAEAVDAYGQAGALQPNDPEIIRNRAAALHNLGRIEDSRADIRRALALNADFAEAHMVLGESLLLTGDFAEGWKEFEWRTRTVGLSVQERSFAVPQWQGEDIAGRTVLLHAEQGLGDMIQFCRFAAAVAARGTTVLLEVPRDLVALMQSLAGPTRVLARGDALPSFDLHCPLMSLPRVLGADGAPENTQVPYLSAEPERVARWSAQIGHARPRRIGLAWAGRATHPNDHLRSIALAALAPLLASDGTTFVALSSELRPRDEAAAAAAANLIKPPSESLTDVAAIIAAVDLVITVDTVFAHLAGALGKPVWVMLPFVPDWRWLLKRSDSPWYPTARLFRQPQPGDWASVIADVRTALTEAR